MKKKRGFTLIETVTYLALFAILMGGGVVTAYAMFESAGRNQAKSILQDEGDFLIGKIEWALSGVQTISSPPLDFAAPTQSSILQVARFDGSSLTLSVAGDALQIQNSSSTYPLNNSGVQVSNLIFTHRAANGNGIDPESITASFTLSTRAENGMPLEQDFSTVKYLRR
jgi:type II secretory pathway pseudopilin PulG